MQEVEIEYKHLLTKDEFERLLNSLSFPQTPQIQTNHYFETADFALKRRGCALRIREKNHTFTLTLKEPHTTGLLETHDTLTQKEANHWQNDFKTGGRHVTQQLADKGIATNHLLYFGCMTTKRWEWHTDNLIFVLDESSYHGITDYELEIEADSETAGLQASNTILADFNIPKRTTPNKIERFFTALKH